jgi:enterochelin esterase-like enzyme
LVLALLIVGACARPTGRFEYVDVDSAAEGTRLRYGVYSPKSWDRRTPLPVVVLLHGAGDDATSADRRSLVRALDRAIEQGELRPFILVTPEGDFGFWLDWHDGSHRWRSWVLDEVVPQVQRRFATIEGPDGLHLVGVSMGGGGGLQMWLAEPARFGSITVLSAPILDEADTRAFLQRFVGRDILERAFGPPGVGVGIDPYAALQQPADLHGSRLSFGAARHDRRGILASNEAFHRRLDAASIPHDFVVFAGTHSWRAWSRVLPYALSRQLGRGDGGARGAP